MLNRLLLLWNRGSSAKSSTTQTGGMQALLSHALELSVDLTARHDEVPELLLCIFAPSVKHDLLVTPVRALYVVPELVPERVYASSAAGRGYPYSGVLAPEWTQQEGYQPVRLPGTTGPYAQA